MCTGRDSTRDPREIVADRLEGGALALRAAERPGPGAEFDLSTSTQWNPGQ